MRRFLETQGPAIMLAPILLIMILFAMYADDLALYGVN